MRETQPYGEEISVEFWPFLDFLTLDNRGVGHTHVRTHTNTQSISTFPIVFYETLKSDNKILINSKQWTGPFEAETHPHARKHTHTITDTHYAA